jgi:hypothetical protein
MKKRTFTIWIFILMSIGLFAQGTIMDFEDEDSTWAMIETLHLDDWQTNPAYSRNFFDLNPDATGMNKTGRCASFSGYNSDDEWWYGFDIVLNDSIVLTEDVMYVHAAMMTTNTVADVNRGLLLFNYEWVGIGETWLPITDEWADYVFPITVSAENIKELRFCLNHKADMTTYLDEIAVNTDSEPRTLLSMPTSINDGKAFSKSFKVYTNGENQIKVVSSTFNFEVEVYNLMGILVFEQIISGNEVTIPLYEKGIYIVRSNNFSEKVLVY